MALRNLSDSDGWKITPHLSPGQTQLCTWGSKQTVKSVVFEHEVKKCHMKHILCTQDSPGPKEWTPKETLLSRGLYPELLPSSMHGQRAAHSQLHANKSLKFKQLSWFVAGSSKAQTCNQMTYATQSQLPSPLLCICSEAAVWQSCPGSGLNVAGRCRHCRRPDCCCAQLCIECFVPFTAAVLHRGILLYAVGFDSKYCMLWGGQELPGLQLLGSVSWSFLSPASAPAPGLGGCPAHAGALWGEQVDEQPAAERTV